MFFKNSTILIPLIFMISCSSSTEPAETSVITAPSIIILEDITDHGADVLWAEVEGTEFYILELAEDSAFKNIVDGYDSLVVKERMLTISELSEFSDYYLRLRAGNSDEISDYSEIVDFKTKLSVDKFTVITEDDVNLNASLRYPEGNPPHKLVIFCHSANSNETEWLESDLLYTLIKEEGIGIVTFDNRDHGESEELLRGDSRGANLLINPDGIPKDLSAIVSHIKLNFTQIDTSNIAIVGSSMGANLALVGIGNNKLNLKTAVSISPNADNVYKLASNVEDFRLNNTFYIASESDQDGQRQSWASELYNSTEGNRKLLITEGDAHGTNIINDNYIKNEIVKWLNSNLDNN